MAVDDVRRPAQFLDGFQNSPTEEDHTVFVVFEEFFLGIVEDGFALEEVLVVNEVDLHPGTLDGGYLDDERVIVLVDDQVHSGKTDDLVELVSAFVDQSESGHKRPNLTSFLLDALR